VIISYPAVLQCRRWVHAWVHTWVHTCPLRSGQQHLPHHASLHCHPNVQDLTVTTGMFVGLSNTTSLSLRRQFNDIAGKARATKIFVRPRSLTDANRGAITGRLPLIFPAGARELAGAPCARGAGGWDRGLASASCDGSAGAVGRCSEGLLHKQHHAVPSARQPIVKCAAAVIRSSSSRMDTFPSTTLLTECVCSMGARGARRDALRLQQQPSG
jgi:hypothetical protein